MSEVAQAYAWINGVMRGDSALLAAAIGGVWEQAADIGTVGPYALYTQQSGIDSNTMCGVRLFSSLLLQMVAIGPVSKYASLVVIADRIDTLFQSVKNVALSSGGVLSCTREQPLAMGEPLVNGQAWQRLGGIYRIQLQGS